MDTTTLIVIGYGISVVTALILGIALLTGETKEFSSLWIILSGILICICPILNIHFSMFCLFDEEKSTYQGLKIMKSTIYKNLVFLPVFLLILLFFI